ncbi:MAG: NAD-dependent epimerase/dehydratase family protein [Treponema sp.]|jgi:nucleoside-diphosphate-sugar epimerase|nr:NAD-dependent epimerase/dehydratase family protein [Treponema sp.]
MKVLFIGGTGVISTAISKRVLELGWDLFLLNRGSRNTIIDTTGKPGKLVEIACDIRSESEEAITAKLKAALAAAAGPGQNCSIQNLRFDVVADFIVFTQEHIEKDYRIFRDLCDQYIFISSASAYQKPLSSYLITESTPLANPYWEYSRNKIACEEFLTGKYRENGFPFTVVRPSHTYDERYIPLGVHGKNGSWQVVKRMLDGKPVIIHGDGTSLWTMTHNSDFARAFTGLMGNIHAIGEAVHITSDESVSWNQAFHAIAAALKVPLKAAYVSSLFLAQCSHYDFTGSLIGDKANSVVFDTTKLKRLVPGFCAQVRFDQGIKETIAHVLSHPECQQEDPEFDAWCDRVIAAQEKALQEVRRNQ